MANKKQFRRTFRGASTQHADIEYQQANLLTRLEDKYYNLFCSSHTIEGDITDELRRYMYKRFWHDGTICLFNIPHTDLVGGCQYAIASYDMYVEPAEVDPVYINPTTNTYIPLVPHSTQAVNKDVVVGWYQRNHKSIYSVVHSYCQQLVDVEMIINTNLQAHKLPYLFNSTNQDIARRLADLIQRILNNEVAIGVCNGDLNDIQVLSSNAPYIIDKLYTYKCDLENELKTYLGLNNSGVYYKKAHTLEAEVDSAQADVNDMLDNIDDELSEFSERIKKTLGKTITFSRRMIPEDATVAHMPNEMKNGEAYQDD